MLEEFTIDSRDMKTKLHAYQWTPKGEVKAVLIMVHGMAEHMMRYAEFAEYLNAKGIVAAGIDLLGHGKSVRDKEDFGYFCERDAATVVVRDVHRLKKTVQEKYPGIPVYLLGHSMGSFIARCYIERYGTGIGGVILLGGNEQPRSAAVFGRVWISLMAKIKGWRYRSPMITKKVFGSYLDRVGNPSSRNDWIVKRREAIETYEKDPLSGFVFTLNGYDALFTLTLRAGDPKETKKIPKDLKIYIMSGSEDPVGEYGAGVKRMADLYRGLGIRSVKMELIEGDRHELHHEEDRFETFEKVADFVTGKERE